jgi:undecaprenol kinase
MSKFTKSLSRSYRAAWRGLVRAFTGERTFRVMVALGLLVIILVSTVPLAGSERLMLLLVTGLVLVLELLNTMVERFMDLMKPRLSAYVRDVKDLMAAAVLVAAVFAALIGIIIFIPHISLLIRQI